VYQADHSTRGVLHVVVCVIECDRSASKMRRAGPTRGCCALGGGELTVGGGN